MVVEAQLGLSSLLVVVSLVAVDSVFIVPSCLYLWRAQLDNCELCLDSLESDT